MDRDVGPKTALAIALPEGIYLAIIIYRYGVPKTALTIALPGDLYIAILMDRYGGPESAVL
jgi:hypothetical protein